MNCRHCHRPLKHTFLDLGFAPPSNAYLNAADLSKPEIYFPLKVKVCDTCWLVQTEDYTDADKLFTEDYAYFSSTSTSWLAHSERYAETIIAELQLGSSSMVIEVASNDGYLLKNFLAAGVPCLGIEPTRSTAEAAESLGIPVLREFFGETLGRRLSAEGRHADLIAGNNVFAHVPDINDFALGLKAALKPDGVITLEFPHLMRLIERRQFDTVYHEHFSYLSLYTVISIFTRAGLRVWRAEELPTHGGSLRVFGCHAECARPTEDSVNHVLDEERFRGLQTLDAYLSLQTQAEKVKDDLVSFLIQQKREGKRVAAYGAAAKGNTLLNFAGIKPDLLPFVCDAAPAKQGRFLPGSHIPICEPEILYQNKLDYLLLLPWNLSDEIARQLQSLRLTGTKFAIALPELSLL
jgi:hypothetical protein